MDFSKLIRKSTGQAEPRKRDESQMSDREKAFRKAFEKQAAKKKAKKEWYEKHKTIPTREYKE